MSQSRAEYFGKNYYSKEKIRTESKNHSQNITIGVGTSKNIVNNLYVHSGLYNFQDVLNNYKTTVDSFFTNLFKIAQSDLEKEIKKAKNLERKVALSAFPEFSKKNGDKAIEKYLETSALATEIITALDPEVVINTLIENSLNNDKALKDSVSIEEIEKQTSLIISDICQRINDDLEGSFKDVFTTFGGIDSLKLIRVGSEKEATLKELSEKPNKFLSISKYKGNLGELAGFLDAFVKNQGASMITNEFSDKTYSNGTIKLVGEKSLNQNKKADIVVQNIDFSYGIQSKLYKDISRVKLHDGMTLAGFMGLPIQEWSSNNFSLEKLLADSGSGKYKALNMKEFENFLQYCIINAYAFKNYGVYLKPSDKKENKKGKDGGYKTYNAFTEEVSFIYKYINYLACYWIGVKIANKDVKDSQIRNRYSTRVAFFYVNNKLIPVSEILQTILDNIKSNSYLIKPGFSDMKRFSPRMLKELKWEALNQGKSYRGQKKYPKSLLKIGSILGSESLKSVSLKIEMNFSKLL